MDSLELELQVVVGGHGCWEPDPCPLQQQPVLVSTELASLQLLFSYSLVRLLFCILHRQVGPCGLCYLAFSCSNKIPEAINSQRRKVYFVSWSQIHSKYIWSYCCGPVIMP